MATPLLDIKGRPKDTLEMTSRNGSIRTWAVCRGHPRNITRNIIRNISRSSLVKLLACPSPNIQAIHPPINTQPHPLIPHFCLYLKARHLLLCYTLQRPVPASHLEDVAVVKVGVAKIPLVLSIREPDLRVLGIPLLMGVSGGSHSNSYSCQPCKLELMRLWNYIIRMFLPRCPHMAMPLMPLPLPGFLNTMPITTRNSTITVNT